MGLAHARQQCLVDLVVAPYLQRRIFVLQAVQARHELVLVALGLGPDGDRQDRLRSVDGRHDHRRAFRCQRVAGTGVGQLGDGADVAGRQVRHRVLLLAAHGEQAVQALVLVCARVGELGVGFHRARQHFEERHLADVRVGDRAEDERQGLAVWVAGDFGGLVAGLDLDGRAVGRCRTDLADELGQAVDPDELGGRAADDREHRGLGHAFGEGVLELLGLDLLALEISLHQRVVGDDDALDQVVVHLVFEVGHVVGDLALGGLAAAAFVEEGGVAEQIGDAMEGRLLADGQLERRHADAEFLAQLVERALERRPLAVELVEVDHAGHAELGRYPPRRLGLHLDALHGADDEHRQVGDAQGGVEVADEVGVAGNVEHVDLVTLVLEGRQSERQRDPPLDLLGIEVSGGRAVLDAAMPVDGARAEQHRFGEAGLACSSVPDECDVADLGRRETLHKRCLVLAAGLDVGRHRNFEAARRF